MFRADRNHVHHLMARAAPERKEIVFVIYFVAAFFCVMAMAVSISRSASLGLALVVIEVIVVLLMQNISVRRDARALSRELRRQLRETFFKDGSVTESSHPDSDLVSTETRTNRAS